MSLAEYTISHPMPVSCPPTLKQESFTANLTTSYTTENWDVDNYPDKEWVTISYTHT